MFENPGDKVKIFAKISFWLGIVLTLLTFFVMLLSGEFVIGLIYTVILALGTWVNALVVYCTGEAAEAARIAAHYSLEIARYINRQEAAKEKEKNAGAENQTVWTPDGKLPAWQRVELEKAEAARKASEGTKE